jgi:hypothetical protein
MKKMSLTEKSTSKKEVKEIVQFKSLSFFGSVKAQDSKNRLEILIKELSYIEQTLTQCIYKQPRNWLEIQKIKTLQALASNSVYLNPRWVIEHEAFLLTTFKTNPLYADIFREETKKTPSKKHIDDIAKNFVEPLVTSSKIMLSKREVGFLEGFIALPGYKYVKKQCSLSTEADFVNKTNVFCKKLVLENKQVIAYNDHYNVYMHELNHVLDQNAQAFISLHQDLETSLQKSPIKDDDEVMVCVSKSLSLKLEDENEDEELKAILEKSKNLSIEYSLSQQLVQYSSPKKEITEEDSISRKENIDNSGGVYKNRLLTVNKKKSATGNNNSDSVASSCSFSSTSF